MPQVRDIEFASTSAANLLPFHGRCHIAYMPSRGVVLGLSKFARLTGLFARLAGIIWLSSCMGSTSLASTQI